MTDRSRAALGALAVWALAGCATGGIPVEEAPTHEVTAPQHEVDRIAEGRLAVTVPGSSSCPNGPVSLSTDGEQVVVLQIGQLFPDRDPCTADVSFHRTEVDLPAGVDPGEEVTVRLRYADGTERTVVLPPAGG